MKKGWIIAIFTVAGCSSSDSDEQSPTDLSASTQGTFEFTEARVRSDSTMLTATGIYLKRLLPNGTYMNLVEDFTVSYAGESPLESCTQYASGRVANRGSSTTSQDVAVAVKDGFCGEAAVEVPFVAMRNIIADGTALKTKNNDEFEVEYPFTYADERGDSKEDALIITFKRISTDTWDGNGLDPALVGTWQYVSLSGADGCVDEPLFHGDYLHEGNYRFTLSADGSYREEYSNAVMPWHTAKCTGTATGTVRATEFGFDIEETSFSDPCASSVDNADPSALIALDRIVVVDEVMVNFGITRFTDMACATGTYEQQDILVFRKISS